jgi:hypothetical protein
MTEGDILLIADDADRSDAVAAFLEQGQPAPWFLNALTKDHYDVIRAEALDYAITSNMSLDYGVLKALVHDEVAPLVRGRLKLYLTISGLEEEASVIRGRVFSDVGKRDKPWDLACDYFVRKDGSSFLAMSRLLYEDDYGVAEITLDLMMLLTFGLHRKLFDALLRVSSDLPELRISRERLAEACEILAEEALPPLSISDLKAQLA